MGEVLDRPVMQLTYPRYRNGEVDETLKPSFYCSRTGNSNKLPIFVHYNGINHYNVFVPKAYPKRVAEPESDEGKGGSWFDEVDSRPTSSSSSQRSAQRSTSFNARARATSLNARATSQNGKPRWR